MRKALIAVIVATALFAVGAFAANFAVNSENIASGSDDVTACADSVDVDFENVEWDDSLTQPGQTATGDWETSSAVVRFFVDESATATPDYAPTDACENYDVTLRVQLSTDGTTAGPDDVTGSATVGAGADSVNVFFTAAQVSLIERASVLIDGEEFTVVTP